MNQKIEKWLTIAALAGWIASIGSLLGLAIRATAPAAASRPAQSSSVSMQHVGRQPSALPATVQESAEAIPLDTSQGYWVESLRSSSYSSKR